MRLNLTATKTTQGGRAPIQSKTYRTTTNNTIFKIVTQGLYIRPIEAIVREICTNALDGHIAAGKTEVPFEVSLPTRISPNLIVRDFGCSMDNDTVFDVYSVLGESTKNSSSNSIGGWGVGGKSPAAYTDTFFITTYIGGKRRIYQSSYLDDRSPLELILEGESDEPQGVEVKIPIKEKDFEKFIDAAKSQLAAFDVKPIIKNHEFFNYKYDLNNTEYVNVPIKTLLPNSEGVLVDTLHQTTVYKNVNLSENFSIRMGCVVYPINRNFDGYYDIDKSLEQIRNLSGDSCFLLDLPVDAVDIKPSREDLDYTERTNIVLNSAVKQLYKHYKKIAISAQFKVRHMESLDAINYIENNYPEGIVFYVLKKLTTKNIYKLNVAGDKHLRTKIKRIPDDFKLSILEGLQNINYDDEIDPYRKLRTCNGEKSISYSNLNLTFCMNPLMEITVFRKDTQHIKRIKYWLEDLKEGECYSGFGSACGWEYGRTVGLKNRYYTNNYLTLTAEQEALFVPFLEKFYKKVHVLDLPIVPKEKVVVKRCGPVEVTGTVEVTTIRPENVSTIKNCVTHNINYSFNNIKSIQSSFEKNNPSSKIVYLSHDRAGYESIKYAELSELSSYFNITFLVFSVPSKFCTKLQAKKDIEIKNIKETICELLQKVSLKDVQKWKVLAENTFFKEDLKHNLYNLPSQGRVWLEIPAVKKYFYGFLPDVKTDEYLQYPFILQSKKSIDYKGLRLEVDRTLKRIEKRTEFLLRIKPTLALTNSRVCSKTILELFALNFKGFKYDN